MKAGNAAARAVLLLALILPAHPPEPTRCSLSAIPAFSANGN